MIKQLNEEFTKPKITTHCLLVFHFGIVQSIICGKDDQLPTADMLEHSVSHV